MECNAIHVKYSYDPATGVLVVDEYLVIENRWFAMITGLTNPFPAYGSPPLPIYSEDILGIFLPDRIPIVYFKITAGQDILAYKWGGSWVAPTDFYLSEWSASRYKLQFAGIDRVAWSNRRLVYRPSIYYDRAAAEIWRGSSTIQETRFNIETTSWKKTINTLTAYQLVYQKTIYTGSSGGCVPGDSSIIIDPQCIAFHQACNGGQGVDWENYDYLADTLIYPCSPTIKNPGPIDCNAANMSIALRYFSGYNAYSSWSGKDFAGNNPGQEYTGIVFADELTAGRSSVASLQQLLHIANAGEVFGLRLEQEEV